MPDRAARLDVDEPRHEEVIRDGARDPAEQSIHQPEIVRLARELAVPDEEVASVYEAELRKLMNSARVTAFVPVLVGRRVRRVLRGMTRKPR